MLTSIEKKFTLVETVYIIPLLIAFIVDYTINKNNKKLYFITEHALAKIIFIVINDIIALESNFVCGIDDVYIFFSDIKAISSGKKNVHIIDTTNKVAFQGDYAIN